MIFSNIEDVQEFTVNLISSLEDALEMAEDTPPLVGGIFEELAEVRLENIRFIQWTNDITQ